MLLDLQLLLAAAASCCNCLLLLLPAAGDAARCRSTAERVVPLYRGESGARVLLDAARCCRRCCCFCESAFESFEGSSCYFIQPAQSNVQPKNI